MRSGISASVLLSFLLAMSLTGCEPEDKPGGELIDIRLQLVGKNPGLEGRYILLVGERSTLRATGTFDHDREEREENITLSLFWRVQPPGYAEVECQKGELTGNRVLLSGTAPGIFEVTAFTREVENSHIPCSPTPDGGWEFPDAGSDWPMQSNTIAVEVR